MAGTRTQDITVHQIDEARGPSSSDEGENRTRNMTVQPKPKRKITKRRRMLRSRKDRKMTRRRLVSKTRKIRVHRRRRRRRILQIRRIQQNRESPPQKRRSQE